ncbi:MAG: AAA family ATPase [Chlamydiota bacterium]
MTNLSKSRRLPIGKDDYKKIIDEDCVYIDKTLLVKEFWDSGSEVILITRPRRFGKSSALSMMRYFFEKKKKPTAYLFEKSKIWQEEGFKELQGTYPVIFISLKDVKAKTWEKAYEELKNILLKEVYRTLEPLRSQMDHFYSTRYDVLINKMADESEFSECLLFITEAFQKFFDKKTIILIDEYDAPITHSYVQGFHNEMVEFMRQLLSKALKGNENLHRALMTGVVRTAKDGILSGLNNPDIYTMLEAGYSDKIGFTEAEVDDLLRNFDCFDKKEELRSWYNGYVVGSKHETPTKIYNPWSVLQYINNTCTPETYWANTGSTDLLARLVLEAHETTQKELTLLLEGNALENKQINQDVILLDLDKKNVEPWSFLFFAGYLTASKHVFQDNKHYYTLSIPNEEITELYKKLVLDAISKNTTSSSLSKLLNALIEGNILVVNKLLEEIISLCSFHDLTQDSSERSLHMFVLGLLAALSERYVIKSNLESGLGRYDIAMYPKRGDPAILIEFKKGKNLKLDKIADQALKQITLNRYESSLKDFGHKGPVLCYGVATFKKNLVAKMKKLSVIP